MTPKSLLGHKDCVSDISEFTPESKFHRVYFDQSENMVSDNEVRRLVFCSGQVYYTLAAERKRLREDNNGNDVSLFIIFIFFYLIIKIFKLGCCSCKN